MKTIIQSVFTLAAIGLVTGCETGWSSSERAGADYSNYILSLQPGQSHSSAQTLTAPIRLAVAQVGETAPSKKMLGKLEEQNALIAFTVGLPLPDGPEQQYANYNQAKTSARDCSARVKSVCSLAQSAGAKYVFLFGGSVDSWRKNNFLTVFDLTVVGAFIVPSSRIEMEGKAAGTLIDAATAEPVFFVSVEAKTSEMTPDYLAEGKTEDMRAQLRDELTDKLTAELLNKITSCNQPATSQNTKTTSTDTN
ncbi:MAG: hypothetical protein WBS33_05840 [Verrucomicrobiia bacterium]